MIFRPALKPDSAAIQAKPSHWFVFKDLKLLVVKDGATGGCPYLVGRPAAIAPELSPIFIGHLDGIDCYAALWSEAADIPPGLVLMDLRQLLGGVDDALMQAAGYAKQLIHWALSHRFCGGCGGTTRDQDDERAKVCIDCGAVYHPRVSPAVIAAVVRENRILLARATRFRGSLHSVLAGYVEPGETLEACVQREISEEVGIRVKNIAYFGSQPWPFPSSLMVAFTAEYAGGRIRIDPSEIREAGWYKADGLPEVPGTYSIAGRLIEWFVNGHNARKDPP